MKPIMIAGEDVIQEMMTHLATTPLDGCIVEVGVYRGGTLWHLAENAKGREVYGYDTFCGIPFRGEWDQHDVGDFRDTSLEIVQKSVPAAHLEEGIFPNSAVPMPRVAFAHLDCDQYQSYIDAINYLAPLMADGGIMWFDDYCLPSGQKAIDEMFGDKLERTKTNKMMVRFKGSAPTTSAV